MALVVDEMIETLRKPRLRGVIHQYAAYIAGATPAAPAM